MTKLGWMFLAAALLAGCPPSAPPPPAPPPSPAQPATPPPRVISTNEEAFLHPAPGTVNVRPAFERDLVLRDFPEHEWTHEQWEIASVSTAVVTWYFDWERGGGGYPLDFKEPDVFLVSFGLRRVKGDDVAESLKHLVATEDEKKAADPVAETIRGRSYYEWRLVARSRAAMAKWRPNGEANYAFELDPGTSGAVHWPVRETSVEQTVAMGPQGFITIRPGATRLIRWIFFETPFVRNPGNRFPEDFSVAVNEKTYPEKDYPEPIWHVQLVLGATTLLPRSPR